jgi:hypothetical protein
VLDDSSAPDTTKDSGLPAGFVIDEAPKAEPFDVKKQNAIMLANMAKQKDAGQTSLLADFAQSGPMGDVLEGLNKGHEGNYAAATHGIIKGVSKVVAPAALPAVVAAPAVAAGGLLLGAAGDYGGRKAASLVTDNPDYQDVAGDVGGLLGGVVGGEGTAKYGPAVGDALIERAARLKEIPAFQRSHAPAAAASMILGPQAGAAVEVAQNPLANEMAGKLLKRNVPWQAPKGAVGLPVIERNMPNVSAGGTGTYAPSAEGVGVAPHDIPVAAEPHMPNVSPEPAERRLFAPSAESVPGNGVVGNETPPSEKTIPDAYRKELLDAMAKEREAKNAAFDAKAASIDPLSPGASPEDVAAKYAESKGLPPPAAHEPVKVDPEFAKNVADAYDVMKHNPSDPRVKQAYDALARETADQFYYIKAHTGLQTEPWTGEGQPYKNSTEMMKDVKENNHMFYFPTESGYGEAGAAAAGADHPLLASVPTGPDGKPGEMPYNDMLRIVHDYIAHAKGGHQFGPNGEENAFIEHTKLYSPDAQAALASETRGQNSWVNFGKHMRDAEGNLLAKGDKGYLTPQQRPFAPQKAGLLPPELRGLNPENVKPALGNEDSLKANAALGNAEDHAVIAKAGETPVDTAAAQGQMKAETTQETVARKTKELQDYLKKQMANPEAGKAEVVTPKGAQTNGSGESKASTEAIQRFNDAKGDGQVVVEQKGKPDQLITDPDHYVQVRDSLKPNQELVRVMDDGTRESIDTSGAQRGPIGYKAKEFTQFAQEAADRIKGGEDETTALKNMEAAMRQEYMKRPASAGVKAREARMSAANFDAVLEKTKLDARVLAASKRK